MAIEGRQPLIDTQSRRGCLLDGGLLAVSRFRGLCFCVGIDQGDDLRLYTFVPGSRSIATAEQLRARTSLHARIFGLGVLLEIGRGLIRLVLAQTSKC